MTVEEIHKTLTDLHQQGKRIFISSSFQTHSIPLLHVVATSCVPVTVVFIQTGFHFPETLQFRDQIAQLLNITVENVGSVIPKNQQVDLNGQFLYTSDPDYCCKINKTAPLNKYLLTHDVWISGVRAQQSATRAGMDIFAQAPNDTVRFHPILDWTMKDIFEYRTKHNLPEHPLDKEGYQSIGCLPCTRKIDLNDERSARWFGLNKTECGLHTDLIS